MVDWLLLSACGRVHWCARYCRSVFRLLIECKLFSFVVVQGTGEAFVVNLEHSGLLLHKKRDFTFFKFEEVADSVAGCFLEFIISLAVVKLPPVFHDCPQHFSHEVTRAH